MFITDWLFFKFPQQAQSTPTDSRVFPSWPQKGRIKASTWQFWKPCHQLKPVLWICSSNYLYTFTNIIVEENTKIHSQKHSKNICYKYLNVVLWHHTGNYKVLLRSENDLQSCKPLSLDSFPKEAIKSNHLLGLAPMLVWFSPKKMQSTGYCSLRLPQLVQALMEFHSSSQWKFSWTLSFSPPIDQISYIFFSNLNRAQLVLL